MLRKIRLPGVPRSFLFTFGKLIIIINGIGSMKRSAGTDTLF